jgi:hypothetical protein
MRKKEKDKQKKRYRKLKEDKRMCVGEMKCINEERLSKNDKSEAGRRQSDKWTINLLFASLSHLSKRYFF